jgi:hypothetical protein
MSFVQNTRCHAELPAFPSTRMDQIQDYAAA